MTWSGSTAQQSTGCWLGLRLKLAHQSLCAHLSQSFIQTGGEGSLSDNLQAYVEALFLSASDQSPDVRKNVCSAPSGPAEVEPGGLFTLGTLNASLIAPGEAISFVPVPPGLQSYWLIPMEGLDVNGVPLPLDAQSSPNVAIDTGTTLIGGPAKEVKQFYSQVIGSSPASGSYQGYYSYPCNSSVLVLFRFGGKNYSMAPDDFNLGPFGSNGRCLGSVFELELSGASKSLISWMIYYNHPQQHDAHHQPASAPVVSLHHIHYQNMAQLLASLFFSAHFHALTFTHQAEIHQDILRIQRAANHVFAPGLNPCLASYQHTLDPIQAQHRPLVFYLVIEACRHLLHLLLNFVGFRQYHIPINQTLFSYWFHPGFASHSPDQKEPPIVLVAGIVGLISLPHYAIYLLWKSPRPIFLVGNLSVSLTLFKPELHLVPVVVEEDESFMRRGDGTKTRRVVYRRKIQTLAEQSACLQKMLHRHGVTPRIMPDKDDAQTPHHQGGAGGAFLIGHSLGTCLTAHFLRHYPQYVSGTLSIDPISVLPYIPDLVRGFLYEEPKTVGQLLVRVISREIGVATVIQRHFHWFEFVMFPHLDQARSPLGVSAAQHRHHFVLSEHDALPTHSLFRFGGKNYSMAPDDFNLGPFGSNGRCLGSVFELELSAETRRPQPPPNPPAPPPPRSSSPRFSSSSPASYHDHSLSSHN
ncbi:hypothetical protein PCANC_25281 [Puccinia coronata f. sp. avenae]|uniref:Peptidase A1 domain-containing protein n=1 Tax=Puccinia coronata f. sp. avenae TaxID=200324 RepID=A0A2N5U5B3_9BASI|nr:hypothetical protein PCANC_25281 [Puccinia coronata f. sp. avenae]